MQEDKEIENRKIKIQELAQYLMKLTHALSDDMDKFVKSFKQFGKTFVFDQMDYSKVIKKEKEEMNDILSIFDIQLKKLK